MSKNIKPISQQVIVITGASSGFGRGAALKFAEKGASLVLAARRVNLLEELAKECLAKGSQVIVVPTDVSKPEEVQNLYDKAIAAFGTVDTWINDAGVGALGYFEDIPLEDHEQVIKTNLLGTLYGTYAAIKHFRKQEQGILINVSSVFGKISSAYYSSYCASKFGVTALTAAIRHELKEHKIEDIHLCTVMPMAMDTPFFEHAGNYTDHKAVPVPPVYDAEKVVDTLVRLAEKPEDEVIVGGAGKVSEFMHRMMPSFTEAAFSKETHKVQMEKPPLAANTSGSIHEPIAEGAGVHDLELKKGKK